MTLYVPGCMGKYDFDHIAHYAKKRYVDGYDTVSLMMQATTDREKEEIALVCMLDVDDATIRDIDLSCRYASECKITTCRDQIRGMIEAELAQQRKTR